MSRTSDDPNAPYLPSAIPRARVLISVKTYPQPSRSYTELVCTAGLLDGERWVRIYPVSLRHLQDSGEAGIPKYSWVELDLLRRTADFRPESYGPRGGIQETIAVGECLDTARNWHARKQHVLHEVYDSMEDLIAVAKSEQRTSPATIRPEEITGFRIEGAERDWKETWLEQNQQGDFFEVDARGQARSRPSIRKLPYKFYYQFTTRRPVHSAQRSHMNAVVLDSDWEQTAAFFLEQQTELVASYARNERPFVLIPYEYEGVQHHYEPDYLVRLHNGVTLVLEVKGQETEQDKAKYQAARRWVTAVNNWARLGHWEFLVSKDPWSLPVQLRPEAAPA